MELVRKGKRVKFRLETGAYISVISKSTLRKLGLTMCRGRKRVRVMDAEGRELEKQGQVVAMMEYKGKRAEGSLHIGKGAPQNLLGIPDLEAFLLIQRINSAAEVKVEARFSLLYRALGQLPETFEIKLREGEEPFAIPVPRRLTLGMKQATQMEL